MQLLKSNPLVHHTDIYAPVNVSNSKKLVLSQFFDILQKNQNADTFKTEKDFDETISKTLKAYKAEVIDGGALTNIDEKYLDVLKMELAGHIAKYQEFEALAEKKAKNTIRLAFLTCFTQFSIMSSAIYGFSSWDVVEPTTFLVTSFWLMTGSAFYIKNKTDFSYESGFDFFYQKELERLIKREKFDTEKKEFLEAYISELESYLNVLKS